MEIEVDESIKDFLNDKIDKKHVSLNSNFNEKLYNIYNFIKLSLSYTYDYSKRKVANIFKCLRYY